MGASLLLRTGALDAGYWIDEGIAVGIASHDFADIPRRARPGRQPAAVLPAAARLDAAGRHERGRDPLAQPDLRAARRSRRRSGRVRGVFDRRAGALAAAGAAGSPFLTYYAQETRMYSLVVLLSILASASFVLAFVRGERRHVVWLGRVARAAALHAHVGAVPGGGDGGRVARAVAARRRSAGATACGSAGVLALALRAVAAGRRLPGRAHRRAVGGAAVAAGCCSAFPGGLFGYLALPLLAVAVFFAMRRHPPVDQAVRVLAAIAVGTTCWRGCARRSSRRGRRATSRSCSARCCSRWPRWSPRARAGPRSRWSASRSSGC